MKAILTDMQEHENEILNSRICGLGGSDAKMVYKVGMNGLASLSETDLHRLAVLKGQTMPNNVPSTPAMEAGHIFEDWVAQLDSMKGCSREVYLESEDITGLSFKVFAHADFYYDGIGMAIECKYVQKDTEKVASDYMAQLQWYFMIGCKRVALFHGTGDVIPFRYEDGDILEIERDDEYINVMLNGLQLLNDFLADFVYVEKESVSALALPKNMQVDLDKAGKFLRSIKDAEEAVAKTREALKQYMEENGIIRIDGDGVVVSYIKASVKTTFDSKKCLAEHPEMSAYMKQSNVKSSIKIEVK